MLTVLETEALAAEALHTSRPSIAQYIKKLQPTGLWFSVGRGRTAAPLKPTHFINLVLACVGGPPSKAVSTVTCLRSLRIQEVRFLQPAKSPDVTVEHYGGQLEAPLVIGGLSIHAELGETLDGLAMSGHKTSVTFRVEIRPFSQTPDAHVHIKVDQNQDYLVHFALVKTLELAQRRISYPVILESGFFSASTDILNAVDAPMSLDRLRAEAIAKNEYGAPGRAPYSHQSRDNETGGLTASQDSMVSSTIQSGASLRRTGRSKAAKETASARKSDPPTSRPT